MSLNPHIQQKSIGCAALLSPPVKLNVTIFYYFCAIIKLDTKEEDIMQVASYTFQSPSSSAVQVGKLDPASVKEEETSKTKKSSENTQAKTLEQNPAIEGERLLDVYA